MTTMMAPMEVSCPSCESRFPVDPARVPEAGVLAICSACHRAFPVARPEGWEPELEEVAPAPAVDSAPAWMPPSEGAFEAATVEEQAVEEQEAEEQEAGTHEVESEVELEPEFEVEPDFEVEAEGEAEVEPAADPEVRPSTGWTRPGDVPKAAPDAPAEEPEEEEPVGELRGEPASEFDEVEAPGTLVEEVVRPEAASPPPAQPEPSAETEVEEDATSPVSDGVSRFARRDPANRARRLARVLASDMITYNPARYAEARKQGTLRVDFQDEIEKSWEEYVDQVGEELAYSSNHFVEALNDVLAQGEVLFKGPGRPW